MIHIKTIHQLHSLAGLEEPKHPLFSIQRIEDLNLDKEQFPEKITYDFFTVGLKKNLNGYVKYGRTNYDFQEGALGFTAPFQLMEFSTDLITNASGWILFFHKELLNITQLEQEIDNYGFFGYNVSEGLHLSKVEEQSIGVIFENIEKEYLLPIDKYSKKVVLSNLELLLTYAHRYYSRQFIIRNEVDTAILTNFKKELKLLFIENTKLPTVELLADKLHLSANYLSDFLKSTTGKSALEHIHNYIINQAKKDLISTEKSISEIAFELGFEYPHYFSRLFKKKTGLTPSEYRVETEYNPIY